MTAKKLYCSKCRDAYAHHIARGKIADDACRMVAVISPRGNGSYQCKCQNCGHTWISVSKEAKEIHERSQNLIGQ